MRRLLLAIAMLSGAASAADIPSDAKRHRADLVRSARVVWGMDAPIATFAAQIHQESGWRAGAVSPVGAQGLTQFMPETASWIGGLYPQTVGAAQPFNPAWSMRALVQYDRWLYDRVRSGGTCDRFAFVLSGYNGGLGWVYRDQKLASGKGLDPLAWFGSVEHVNSGRSTVNWNENRQYPRRILQRYEPLYVAAAWGPGSCP